MIYEGQICRGPMERSSFMLPVAVGCSYNCCRFCNLFKHLKYRQLPMEQVEEEILRVQALGGDPETVFLGDGNAFGLETGHLLEIAGEDPALLSFLPFHQHGRDSDQYPAEKR